MLQSSLVSLDIKPEMARLGPFDVGQILAHAHHGLSAPKIVGLICKADGCNPCKQATHHHKMQKSMFDPQLLGGPGQKVVIQYEFLGEQVIFIEKIKITHNNSFFLLQITSSPRSSYWITTFWPGSPLPRIHVFSHALLSAIRAYCARACCTEPGHACRRASLAPLA